MSKNGDHEGRLSEIMEGVKHGAVKEGIDLFVGGLADPIVKNFVDKFEQENPMFSGMVDSGVRFIIMVGLAEALVMLGPTLGGFLGQDGEDGEEKARLLSMYVRRYAGEKLGEEAMKSAVAFIPQMMSGLKNIKTDDVKNLLEAQGVNTEPVPTLENDSTNSLEELLKEVELVS